MSVRTRCLEAPEATLRRVSPVGPAGRTRRGWRAAARPAAAVLRGVSWLPRLACAWALLGAVLFVGGCAEDISGTKEEKPVRLLLKSEDPASVERPAWIANDRIVFSWDQGTSTRQLWTIDLDDGRVVRYKQDNERAYENPVYSSDLGLLAFELTAGQFATSSVSVGTADGSVTAELVADPAFSARFPCWGPDGGSLGYMKIAAGQVSFVMVELDKSFKPLPRLLANVREVVLDQAFQPSRAAWYAPAGAGPFGGKVAYNRIPPAAQGGTEIYYYDLDEDREVRLTSDATPDASNNSNPSWSPDGDYIVYSSDFKTTQSPEFRRELFVVNVQTKEAVRLTVSGQDEADPAWSPDGTMIAYVSDGDLYVLTVDPTVLP